MIFASVPVDVVNRIRNQIQLTRISNATITEFIFVLNRLPSAIGRMTGGGTNVHVLKNGSAWAWSVYLQFKGNRKGKRV